MWRHGRGAIFARMDRLRGGIALSDDISVPDEAVPVPGAFGIDGRRDSHRREVPRCHLPERARTARHILRVNAQHGFDLVALLADASWHRLTRQPDFLAVRTLEGESRIRQPARLQVDQAHG